MSKRQLNSVRGEQPIAYHRESDGTTQSLAAHLLGVATRARCFAKKIGLADQGELIGLLHDLGKYSNQFQNYGGYSEEP